MYMDLVLDAWYPIARSRSVGRRPVRLRRHGDDLVLWRTTHGTVAAALDRCPHKGARLSDGSVIGDCIACPYHGFRYSPDGECRLQPCEGTNPPIGRLRLDTVVVRERNGLLWRWWSAAGSPAPDEIPWFENVLDTELAREAPYSEWDRTLPTSFQRYMENSLDVHHFAFVHRRSLPGIGSVVSDVDVAVNGRRVSYRASLARPGAPSRPVKIDVEAPALMLDTSGSLWFLVAACPVDDRSCWFAARVYATRADGARHLARRAAAQALRWMDDLIVIREDRHSLSALQPIEGGFGTDRLVTGADRATAAYQRLVSKGG